MDDRLYNLLTLQLSLIEHAACGTLTEEILTDLLAKKVNINLKDSQQDNALNHAIMNGHTDVFWLLLKHGATLETRPLRLLNQAIISGNKEMVNAVFEASKNNYRSLFSISVPVMEYILPLHLAASQNYSDICELLIEKGIDIESKALSGKTALETIVAEGISKETAETLIRLGAAHERVPDYLNKFPDINRILSRRRINEQEVQESLSKNPPSHNLLGALEFGKTELAEQIIHEHYADKDLNTLRKPLLAKGITSFNTKTVAMLLKHGIHIDKTNIDDYTTLRLVIGSTPPNCATPLSQDIAKASMVQFLIEHNVSLANNELNVALTRAAKNHEVHTMKVLLTAGADSMATDVAGNTIFDLIHMPSLLGSDDIWAHYRREYAIKTIEQLMEEYMQPLAGKITADTLLTEDKQPTQAFKTACATKNLAKKLSPTPQTTIAEILCIEEALNALPDDWQTTYRQDIIELSHHLVEHRIAHNRDGNGQPSFLNQYLQRHANNSCRHNGRTS